MGSSNIFYLYEGGIVGIDTIETKITKFNIQKAKQFEVCYDRYSLKYKKRKNQCYVFSIENEVDHVKFISKRDIYIKNEVYTVYKFLYNDPNIQDEEEMYFYSQDVGVVIRRNLSWGGYERIILFSNNIKKTQIAFLLGDEILQDSDFFNQWKK